MESFPNLLTVLKLLGGSYVLFIVVMSFLAIRTAPRKIFLPLLVIASVTPFVLIWSVFRAFFPNRNSIPAYNEKAALVEDKIEAKRVAIYGGSAIQPSISEIWQSMHHRSIQLALGKTVSAAKKILSFGNIVPGRS